MIGRISDPAPLVKPWWQSKTIIGIIGLVAVFIAERADMPITKDEAGEIITLIVGLASAALAIVGRVKARKELRATVPGGKFNPNAEVRKPRSYRFPKSGGRAQLSALVAGLVWMVTFIVIGLAVGQWQRARGMDWREMVERRDAMLRNESAPEIRWTAPEDKRPSYLRFLDSLNFSSALRSQQSGTNTIYSPEFRLTGGAEF
jgi:hypothetical protein